MALEGLGKAELIGLGIALALLVMSVLGFLYYLVTGRSLRRTLAWVGFGRTKLMAEEGVAEFASELMALVEKQQILGAHAGEYFNTIQGAGWSDLQVIIEDLKVAHDLLQFMIVERQYDAVCDLVDYLMDRLTPSEAQELAAQYDGLATLENWRSRSWHLLKKIVNATATSAQQTRELGVTRDETRRRSTLLSLQKVRDYLGDL